MAFPSTIKKELICRKHPTWDEFASAWQRYDLLAEGGERLRKSANQFLVRKPYEPDDVYQVRLSRFCYENHIGAVIGWYIATLFARDPEIDVKRGEIDLNAAEEARKDRILNDSDRQGHAFVDFFRNVLRDLLKYRTSWVLVDRLPQERESRADEKGRDSDPYLVRWEPRAITNWFEDDDGELEQVVLEKSVRRGLIEAEALEQTEYWVYDRTDFAVYADLSKGQDSQEVTKVREGRHALASQKRVPFVRLSIPCEHWLSDRASLAVCEHLDTDNTHSFKLFMANLPVLVFYSEQSEISKTLAEWSYMQLAPGDKAEWLEPGGASFTHSAARLSDKREEIYRLCYLGFQGRSTDATASALSGESKRADMKPAQDVQEAFGDKLRTGMDLVLRTMLLVDGITDATVEVRGFNFIDDEIDAFMRTVEEARRLSLTSDTLYEELDVRATTRLLQDAKRETIETAVEEIRAGMKHSEKLEQQRQDAEFAFGGQSQ